MVVYSYSGIWVSGKLQSIRRSFRILRRSKSDAVVRRVIHRIIALEERVPDDEVETLAGISTPVGDDEVVPVGVAADVGVECAREELRVGREGVVHSADG